MKHDIIESILKAVEAVERKYKVVISFNILNIDMKKKKGKKSRKY